MSRVAQGAEQRETEASDWARPIVKESLSEGAYAAIRDALMRGRLRPGERLLLRPTSTRFGISATPMREALLRLVSEKALTLDVRGTVMVPKLTREQLLEIREIRVALEGRSAAAAAERAAVEDIDALDALHARLTALRDREEFEEAVDLNTEFHLRLCRLAGAPITYEIVEGLWVRCGPILSHLYDSGVPDLEPHPHLRVIAALRARNVQEAREAISEDIVRGGRGLLDYLETSAR